MQKDRSVPPHSDVSLFANEMGKFFIAKKLDEISRLHPPFLIEPDWYHCGIELSNFRFQTT